MGQLGANCDFVAVVVLCFIERLVLGWFTVKKTSFVF